MMNGGKKFLFVLLLPVLAGLCACGYFEAKDNTEKLKQIRIGMTHAEVRDIMGEPPAGSFQRKNLLFYYTSPKWYDGLVTSDECTPFVFDPDDDALLGFGYEYYNGHVVLADHNAEESAAKEENQLRDAVIRRKEELTKRP